MEHLISFLFGAAIREFYAWIPRICDRLIDRAVRKLPSILQSGCRNDWIAEQKDYPNSIMKIITALSHIYGANEIVRDYFEGRIEDARYAVGQAAAQHTSILGLTRKMARDLEQSRQRLKTFHYEFSANSVLSRSGECATPLQHNASESLQKFTGAIVATLDRASTLTQKSVESAQVRLDDLKGSMERAAIALQQAENQFRNGSGSHEEIDALLDAASIEIAAVNKGFEDDKWGDDTASAQADDIRQLAMASLKKMHCLISGLDKTNRE